MYMYTCLFYVLWCITMYSWSIHVLYMYCTMFNVHVQKMYNSSIKKMKSKNYAYRPHRNMCAHLHLIYILHDIHRYVRYSVRTSAQPFHIFNAITFFERFECSDWIWNTNCEEGSLLARNFRLAKIWIFNLPLMFTHSLTHSLTCRSKFKEKWFICHYLLLFACEL
jgi:hypothetical protein